MCITFVYVGDESSPYKYVIGANRDEYMDRPSLNAAPWSAGLSGKEAKAHAFTFAGRDVEKGGTWLGVRAEQLLLPVAQAMPGMSPKPTPETTAADFRFGLLTNHREHQGVASPGPPKPSRGHFIPKFLSMNHEGSTLQYANEVMRAGHDYAGFNLLVGDSEGMHFVSNRGLTAPVKLSPGFHGLSNGTLDDAWPKVVQGKEHFHEAVHRHLSTGGAGSTTGEGIVIDAIFGVLEDPTPVHPENRPGVYDAEAEKHLSSVYVEEFDLWGNKYGTRSSAVILVRKDGTVAFSEKAVLSSQRDAVQAARHNLVCKPIA